MLSGIQFHIIFQKIFLVYTIYLEIPLLGIYSKDIEKKKKDIECVPCLLLHMKY